MKTEIGAYEAKTRLPELLRAVKAGQRFTITNRGEAIADLVPSADVGAADPRAAVERFRKFMQANPVKSRAKIRTLIAEGRE
jgi:prevent-host-death family protein